MQESKKRRTAYKLWISQILKAEKELLDNKLQFIKVNNNETVRVNIIGSVVDKFQSISETKYSTITIDDSSGQIRIKAFSDDTEKLSNINRGDVILVIGLIRYFNNELYILPEIIKKVEPKYLVVRKLELEKIYGKILPKSSETQFNKTKDSEETQTQLLKEIKVKEEKIGGPIYEKHLVLDKIKSLESENEEGAEIDKVIMSLDIEVEKINSIIKELLEEGSVYEPRPGKLKVL